MICSVCNKEFIQTHHRQKYCSKECKRVVQKEHTKKYEQSGKGKTALKKYHQSDKYKKSQDKYLQTDKGKNNRKETIKKYQQSDKGREYQKKYQQSDKYKKHRESDGYKKIIKKYHQSDQHRTYIKKYRGSEQGKEVIRKYDKERQKTDPVYKLSKLIRSRLLIFLKATNMKKSKKTFEMVGCTPEFLKKYLEKQFYPHPITNEKMTWKNHTFYGWHVDHKTPLSSAKSPEDLERLIYYTNLQPMWAEENWKKNNKII